MDEQDEHWNEILKIAKSANEKKHSAVTELDKDAKARLDANIHAHIDQQFKVIKNEQDARVENTNAAAPSSEAQDQKPSFISWLQDQLSHLAGAGAPAFALVALFAITIGLFTVTRDNAEPFSDVPDSLFAELDAQITLSNGGQRAFSATASPRRNAFLSGAIKADLDVTRKSEGSLLNIINNHPEFFGDNDSATEEDRLAIFEKQSDLLLEKTDTSHWLKEGYLIELTQLAALHAMDTTDITPLNDLIQYLSKSTELQSSISNSAGLEPNYISNRKEIIENTLSEEFAPVEIQRIIDLTRNLQVLVQ